MRGSYFQDGGRPCEGLVEKSRGLLFCTEVSVDSDIVPFVTFKVNQYLSVFVTSFDKTNPAGLQSLAALDGSRLTYQPPLRVS